MSNGRKLVPGVASSLCLECGLCCDGSIFSNVELDHEDCDRLELDHEDSASLFFPCEHLSGKRCTVYQNRPKICANYRCKTIAGLEAGSINHADAQDIIRKAANLGRDFEDAIPLGITRKQAIICVAKNQCPQEASDEEFLRLRLTYVALQAMVDRHMRRKDENVVRSAMVRSAMRSD